MKKLLIILLLCLFCSPALAQIKPMLGEEINWGDPVTKGLVGAWFFLGGSGNKVYDLSGNGNTGTLVADTHWVPGKFGSALDFDGTGDYVDTSFTCSSNGTLVIWYKTTQMSGVMFGRRIDDAKRLYIGLNNNKFYASVGTTGGGTHEDSTATNDGLWHCGVVTWQVGGRVKIYVDGLLVDDDAIAGDPGSVGEIVIGARQRPASVDTNYLGLLDHLIYYNIPKSAFEIALLCREPFGMFVDEDIAILEAGIPAPTGAPQVIIISRLILLTLLMS